MRQSYHIGGAELTGADVGAVGQALEEDPEALFDIGREGQTALGAQFKQGLGHVASGPVGLHDALNETLQQVQQQQSTSSSSSTPVSPVRQSNASAPVPLDTAPC